jgi:hypothetical protein
MDINDLAEFLIADSSDSKEDDELPDELNPDDEESDDEVDNEDLAENQPDDLTENEDFAQDNIPNDLIEVVQSVELPKKSVDDVELPDKSKIADDDEVVDLSSF